MVKICFMFIGLFFSLKKNNRIFNITPTHIIMKFFCLSAVPITLVKKTFIENCLKLMHFHGSQLCHFYFSLLIKWGKLQKERICSPLDPLV